MASYSKNIVPEYSYWGKEGQALPDDTRGRIDFGAGGAAYFKYPLSDFNIWSEVYVACAGCNCELAIFIAYTDKETLEQYTYTIALPSSGYSGPLPLHSVKADFIMFRVKAYTAGYVERLTVQPVEQAGTASGSTQAITATANSTFSSIGTVPRQLVPPMLYLDKGYEYNLAMLCLRPNPSKITVNGSVVTSTTMTINVQASVTVALIPDSPHITADVPVTVTLYYGMRQIKSTVEMLSATYTTGNRTITLSASLHASILTEYDLLQNIPLSLTVSSTKLISVWTDSVELTATGDVKKLDAYIPSVDFDETVQYPRICATYNTDGHTIDKLWYIVRQPSYKYNIYAIDYNSDGYDSDAESNSLSATYMGNFTATSSKAQIQAITRIDYIENTTYLRSENYCNRVSTHETMLRFWLYQGTLYCSTLEGASQVTLATNVVDFDTVQQGVYSWPDRTYSTHGVQHIMGVTVFYAKSDGTLWFATYPDPTSTSFDYITVPYDSTAWKTYQVTLPTSISSTLTAIKSIAMSTPRLVDNNDSNTTCIVFGLWANVTDSALGTQDLYGYVSARKRYTSTDSSGTTKVDPAVTEVRTYGFSYLGYASAASSALYGRVGDLGTPCYIVAQPFNAEYFVNLASARNSFIISNHVDTSSTLSPSVCNIAYNLRQSDTLAPATQGCPPLIPCYPSANFAFVSTMPSGETMAFIYDSTGLQIYGGIIPLIMMQEDDTMPFYSDATATCSDKTVTIYLGASFAPEAGTYIMMSDMDEPNQYSSDRTRRTIITGDTTTKISRIPTAGTSILDLSYTLRRRAKTNYFAHIGWLPLPHVTVE